MSFAVFFIFNKGLRQSLSLFANFVQGEHTAQLAEAMLNLRLNSCTQKNIAARI
jgi:hypothetical protein